MSDVVLFDVDCTISNGQSADRCEPRPGISFTSAVLRALGYRIHVWSAGGEEHARDVAARCGLDAEAAHAKPDYPITEQGAFAVLGFKPALVVDDDPTESIPDVPFLAVEPFWGTNVEVSP